jgi:hypothetical protein
MTNPKLCMPSYNQVKQHIEFKMGGRSSKGITTFVPSHASTFMEEYLCQLGFNVTSRKGRIIELVLGLGGRLIAGFLNLIETLGSFLVYPWRW